MAKYNLVLPSMGEGVMEATITGWLKEVGDEVEIDESVVEIATDKVDSDVPSEVSGKLIQKLKEVDEVAQIGETIAIIEIAGEDDGEFTPNKEDFISTENKEEIKELEKPLESFNSDKGLIVNTQGFLSPLVKSMIQKENLTQNEVDLIKGSGLEGRITKDDIVSFLENRKKPLEVSAPVVSASPTKEIIAETVEKPVKPKEFNIKPEDEIIEMDRMRSLISNYMVESKKISPHVTSFIEADVTNLVKWRTKNKDEFKRRTGERLTFTPLFVQAIVKAILDFPMINISVIDNKIIKKKNINIGVATALPNGNLIVPVVKNADQLSIFGLAKSINTLVDNARKNNLKPSDITEGTYTLTNIGTFGNLMGTPIINQPQVAIMAVGAIQKKVSVIETPTGDTIGIRQKMYLSHTYDHRVVDGSLGGMFLKRVSDYLENFNVNTEV